MNDQPTRPWPKVPPARRWGPVIVVVALIVGSAITATVKANTFGSTSPAAPSQRRARSYADDPRLPVTYADAQQSDTLADYDWGRRCDPTTGRIKVPSVYAPPCVPVWGGTKPWKDKGGSTVTTNGADTAPGVTADSITVAYYAPGSADLAGAMQALGVVDQPGAADAAIKQLVEQGNALFETYGRTVKVIRFDATNDGKNPSAARADAIRVADELGAFASIGGPAQTSAYQDELARRNVLCIACGYSTPSSTYERNAPYSWGQLATPDQLVYGVLDFGVRNLFGRPATFAGDPAMRTQTRRFGIVNYDQDPPVFGDLERTATARYRKKGFSAAVQLSYLLDPSTLSTQAQTIIGKLKEARVTSVVFLGDPLMPKFLTEQATKQDYYPEWIVTGTVFTDSTAAGRLYDPAQWANAFGISSLPSRARPELSESWRLYRWFFGADPTAKSLPVLAPLVTQLFLGIDLAGPALSAETFAGGLFSYPPSGGGPTTPRVSYGFHGVADAADYVGVDDFTIVWWDATAVGPDEQNKEGTGMWRYATGGKRYLLGDVPRLPDSTLFEPDGAVTLQTDIPAQDRPPTYPPWPGSPADKQGG